MAVFSRLFSEQKEKIVREFQDQCLDFIAQNPPRMGVNWVCTMDVGIRTANMALAYSLFCTNGCTFDDTFRQIFLRSIYEHCHHIRTNLEYSVYLTSNHYLANVAGLLFGAALFPTSKNRDKWLDFAIREVRNEIIKQFYEEGSNFEGSTAYHRLSSDMAVYSAALISALECKSIENEIADRIHGMAKFLTAVTRPDNVFSQIGDNDSGFFFRLSPTGVLLKVEDAKKKYKSLSSYSSEKQDENYLDENLNDGRPVISAISGLFETNVFSDFTKVYPLEYSMIRMLCNGFITRNTWKVPQVSTTVSQMQYNYHKEMIISSGGVSLTRGLYRIDFPAFGLYLFRSDMLYLLVNASDNGQKGNGGHAHNDKLSFELLINGRSLYEDPGQYVYTPLPELRNKYRSTYAHNTINTGIEQNEFINLFSMKNQSKCSLLQISNNAISLLVEYRDVSHRREFKIEDNRILIIDDCNKPFELVPQLKACTAGYGKLKYWP
jgi:hypothetical protein